MMVEGYYNKVYTYMFKNYINVNNINNKAMKTFEVKYNYQNLVNVLIQRNKAVVLKK